MKRKALKALSLVLALVIGLSVLTACGSSVSKSSTEASNNTAASEISASASEKNVPDPVTLKFYFPGETPNDMQSVLDEFYNRTKDTLNTKLEFHFINWNDIKTKISLMLSAGEEVDSVFDAPWLQMPQMIAQDQYQNLDKYFNSDEYPGLKKAYPADFINANRFKDKNNESHIYAIPFSRGFTNAIGVYIRKDLREKYGLPEINSLEDLEKYFDAVLKNEKGIVPLGVDAAAGCGLSWLISSSEGITNPNSGEIKAGGINMSATLTEDKKHVVIGIGGSNDKDYQALQPAPWNTAPWDRIYKRARDWYVKGYVEKDILSQKNALGMFSAGKFAAVFGSGCNASDVYASVATKVESAIPDSKVEFFAVCDDVRQMKPHSVLTDYTVGNYACIPVSSKNIDRTMNFFEWLYSDQKNHDLFEYGIEGKHWVAEENDQYKIPDGIDGAKNYNFPGYVLTWNNNIRRWPVGYPENLKKLDLYFADMNTYTVSPFAGFTGNNENIKSEVAKVSQVNTNMQIVDNGLSPDYAKIVDEFVAQREKAGMKKIREEYTKQLNDWLAKNPVK